MYNITFSINIEVCDQFIYEFCYFQSLERTSSDKAYIFPSWHDYKHLNFQIALMFLKLV